MGGAFLNGLTAEWLVPNRAVRFVDNTNQGWLFVVYGTNVLSVNDDTLIAEDVGNGQSHTVSLLAAPLGALSDDQVDVYLNPTDTVSVVYQALNQNGGTVGNSSNAVWDAQLGLFRISLKGLNQTGLNISKDYDAHPTLHNWYGRHRLTVDTGHRTVAVPMAFFGNGQASLYITGGVASLRDPSGEPIGVPVQISKNWHDASTGAWYHFYSQPVFSGEAPQTMELTIASSRWGRLFMPATRSAQPHWL